MEDIFAPGTFHVGCNYWASHAGTSMWSNWRPQVVAADFRRLAAAGVEVVRVFPLWPDFQPLTLLRGGHGRPVEYRFREEPLPDTEAGRAGVSEVMLGRFAELERAARRSRIRLVVGLVTGWMSGRLFVPPAFEGLNMLADPAVLRWQVRFVRHFVRRFRRSPAIVAWDLGNECNCTASVSRDQAWTWTALITDAIRTEDPGRPVVSGMHSLTPDRRGSWRIQDQAELTDLLTTHPYPPFTPHCDLDPIPTMRPCLHATAESRMYGDIGGKPCLAEEFGTLGPAFADDANAAAYVRANLFSLWAHDCRALLWWCAFDQDHLARAPYDWCNVERELGLLRKDGTPKPFAAEFGKFRRFLRRLPFRALPPRVVDAVTILTPGQDSWAAAYSAFILAKQAGRDIEFQYADAPVRPASAYLLPSVSGLENISRRRQTELLARVRAGARLYISLGDGILSGFEPLTGLRIRSRRRRAGGFSLDLAGISLPAASEFRFDFKPTRAEVLAAEPDGNPAFSRAKLGRGEVFFLSFPLETWLAGRPGAFHGPDASEWRRIYERFFSGGRSRRIASRDNPSVGLTEHELGASRRVVVALNYSAEPERVRISLAPGWKAFRLLHGSGTASQAKPVGAGQPLLMPLKAAAALEHLDSGLALGGNDALVFLVRR